MNYFLRLFSDIDCLTNLSIDKYSGNYHIYVKFENGAKVSAIYKNDTFNIVVLKDSNDKNLFKKEDRGSLLSLNKFEYFDYIALAANSKGE